MPDGFSDRCDAIEECYEFMLAYAGQGLPSDQGSQAGSQVREFLQRAVNALAGLAESCAQAVAEQGLERRRNVPGLHCCARPRCPGLARRTRTGTGSVGHQLSVDRQSERIHPSPGAAYRPVFDWRDSGHATQPGPAVAELYTLHSHLFKFRWSCFGLLQRQATFVSIGQVGHVGHHCRTIARFGPAHLLS